MSMGHPQIKSIAMRGHMGSQKMGRGEEHAQVCNLGLMWRTFRMRAWVCLKTKAGGKVFAFASAEHR